MIPIFNGISEKINIICWSVTEYHWHNPDSATHMVQVTWRRVVFYVSFSVCSSVPLLTWVSAALFSGHHLQLQELLPLYMTLITLRGSSGKQAEMTVVHVELLTTSCPLFYTPPKHKAI